jgi:hypothetical protein
VFKTGFNIALQIWVVFLLCFFLLRYSAPVSILLGALAAIAGGTIAAYVKTENQSTDQKGKDGNQDNAFKRAQRRLPRLFGSKKAGEDGAKGRGRGWFAQTRRRGLRRR